MYSGAVDAKKCSTFNLSARAGITWRVGAGEKTSLAEAVGIPCNTQSMILKNNASVKLKSMQSSRPGACHVHV